ncbi:predicted protein [Aspergillus nidulans FGSC A4]|uniref:Uncharacterized protein n=1 Tax=Emericella nidulans (strain FGSC A4 / ATCC 38163 / CBS 112.46 / NRRL 194 / M139) TaxID=227321 RepID=Q5BAV7_EMENI|nr:hypothetical protein [Aspergillus nidulans FGSC A4]EAA64434.1 predicted protein [Aspergillus nidulans FGSC A4]CBF86606.1 TPA: hypothetical protein ANIA_02323 [Aspergillus nidulans FGSC A4]|eukprot:XP_659927.1 predicted protein [Aspergillus nidulans FGSC A4]
MYEELGLPTEDGGEGKTQTVSPFVYFKTIYELGHGLNLLTLHHTRQYQAMTTLNSDERVHASGFWGYCVEVRQSQAEGCGSGRLCHGLCVLVLAVLAFLLRASVKHRTAGWWILELQIGDDSGSPG